MNVHVVGFIMFLVCLVFCSVVCRDKESDIDKCYRKQEKESWRMLNEWLKK